jgi:hypothetical protein
MGREKVSRGKREGGETEERLTGDRVTRDTFDLDAGRLVLEDDGALNDQLEFVVAVFLLRRGGRGRSARHDAARGRKKDAQV